MEELQAMRGWGFQGDELVDTEFKVLESLQAEKSRSVPGPPVHIIHTNLPLKITKTKQDKDA